MNARLKPFATADYSSRALCALLGAGGLTLAWIPIQYAFWPVVAIYAIAAIGLRVIRKRSEATPAAERNAAA